MLQEPVPLRKEPWLNEHLLSSMSWVRDLCQDKPTRFTLIKSKFPSYNRKVVSNDH